MLFALLCAVVVFALVKVASTIWLVCQPDATTVTATSRGRVIYYASKVSPALFVAALLARAYLQGASLTTDIFWAVLLLVSVVMAIAVVRQRAAGTWYGYAHEFKNRRHGPRGP